MSFDGGWDGAAPTGGPGDLVDPVVTAVSPTPGVNPGDPGGFSAVYDFATRTPVVLDVIDTAPGLRLVLLTARFNDTLETLVVHDGIVFRYPFDTTGSTRTAIPSGYRYTVLRRDGWPPGEVVFNIHAVDRAGNLEGD